MPASLSGLPSASQRDPHNLFVHKYSTPAFQEGIKPSGFKALIDRGQEEFSTMKRQDSEEFFGDLVTLLRRHARKTGREGLFSLVIFMSCSLFSSEPTEVFAFGMEQRLQCTDCKRVRYRMDKMDVVSVAVPATEKGKGGRFGRRSS
jgi:ubiquitin carboxyl-terminal hydrolase 5/13